MGPSQQLSPRGAVIMGLLFIACGAFPILIGLGVITPSNVGRDPAPAWVIVATGLAFVSAGLAMILDYAVAGGVGADGDLKPGTPLVIRAANLLLGMMIVGLMLAIFGWIAFAPGPRHFSTSVSLPFISQRWQSNDLTGRIAFGFGTLLFAVLFVGGSIAGVRRLVNAIRSR